MTIAPNPLYPERSPQNYGRSMGPSIPGNRGPLRHEEGVATDTDVPSDFARGAYYDTTFAPGRINHNNPEMVFKYPEETMRERAHVGSASWVEAPTVLSDFVQGASTGQVVEFEQVNNPGTIQARRAQTVVFD